MKLYKQITSERYLDMKKGENLTTIEIEYLKSISTIITKTKIDNVVHILHKDMSILVDKLDDEYFVLSIPISPIKDYYYLCDTFEGVKQLFKNLSFL